MADASSLVLALVRLSGAAVNLVHDCDEVYNYWEPLHYLIHGFGMQTWEYSARYALRPYLYLILHWPIAAAATALFGEAGDKWLGFYFIRLCLSLVAVVLECSAVRKHLGGSWAFAALLAFSTGCYLAPSTLLPSTLAMYCMTAATVGILNGSLNEVILASTAGVLLGWPVAGVAFAPYAVFVLASPRLPRSFGILAATAGTILALEIAVDWHFYGKFTVTLWNFVQYNVIGGGDSALYGVEPWYFYFFNGTLNFNLVLMLALAFPLLYLAQLGGLLSTQWQPRLAIATGPLYVWLFAISAMPHKEERFLYVAYPQIVLAAACTLSALPRLASDVPRLLRVPLPERLNRDSLRRLGGLCAHALMFTSVLISISRTKAILRYYGAAMHVWQVTAEKVSEQRIGNASEPLLVCVAEEWYHFPSSFFLPAGSRLAFIDSSFDGLLPKAFEEGGNGTMAEPPELNDRNKKDTRLLHDKSNCTFIVGLQSKHFSGPSSSTSWDVVYSEPYLEHEKASFPFRSFWLPWWESYLPWSTYGVWKRTELEAPATSLRSGNVPSQESI